MRVRWFVRSLVALAAVALAMPAFAGDAPRPLTRAERNPANALAPAGTKSLAKGGMGQYVHPSNPICTQTWHQGNVYRTDCEGNAPDNETSIAIDPTDRAASSARRTTISSPTSPAAATAGTRCTRARCSRRTAATRG